MSPYGLYRVQPAVRACLQRIDVVCGVNEGGHGSTGITRQYARCQVHVGELGHESLGGKYALLGPGAKHEVEVSLAGERRSRHVDERTYRRAPCCRRAGGVEHVDGLAAL